MKKFLAVALAVVMMFSISVVSFADYINPIEKDTAQASEVVVQTSAAAADDTYTVTVPASPINVTWGSDQAFDASYSVNHNLVDGSQLVVSVAAANLKDADSHELTLTLSGTTTAQTYTGYDNGTAAKVSVSGMVSGWDSVPAGSYSGTITYTATYTPA